MIDEHTSLEELAAIVSEALEEAGIIATLSGGAAVSIYSDDVYPCSITQRRIGIWNSRQLH